MTMDDGPSTADRVRYLLSRYFTVAVAACVVLAVGGLVVAVDAHTGPATETEQQVVATWSSQSAFDHAAVAQRDTLAFDEGDVLRDRSRYFATVTPILNGSYVYEYAGDAESTTVSTDLALVVRSVSRAGERDVLWRHREPLASETTESLGPDETHQVPFEVNVTDQAEFALAVQEDLAVSRGTIEVLVVAETRATTTLEGEELVDNRTEHVRAVPEVGTYAVSTNVSGERGRQVTRPVDVPVESSPLRDYGSILALLLGTAGAAGLLYARREGELEIDPATRTAISLASERDSFDEWISTGRVPPAAESDRVVVLDSLADLVDVAIDTDRRVVEDANTEAFVVLDGETRYEYWPASAAGPAFVESEAGSTAGTATAETAVAEGSTDEDGREDGPGEPDDE